MKKNFKLFFVMVAVVSLFTLAGCGKDLSKYAGTYEGMYTRFVGDPADVTNKEEFTLVLKKDGKGIHERNGEKYNLTWTVKGDTILVTEKFMGVKIEYNGKIKDNVLTLHNGDSKDPFTMQYIYQKK